jgi:hypothetical protein
LRHLFAAQLPLVQKQAILSLWRQQLTLKTAIENELAVFAEQQEYSRYYLNHVDELSAAELLRAVIVARTGLSPTRPQLVRAILAVKTARPHTSFEIGAGVRLKFKVRTFIVETP